MKNVKKLEEIFEDKIAVPPLVLLQAYEIIYYAAPKAPELVNIFKEFTLDKISGGVIFTEFEQKYLITSEVTGTKLTYRICEISYSEDIEEDTPYTISSPAVHIRRTLGDLIQYFFNIGILIEYTDFFFYADVLSVPLSDHFAKFPIFQKTYNK